MDRVIHIENLECDGLAPYARLTEAQLRSRREPEQGIFIAESAKVIECALKAGCRPVSMLMEEHQLTGQGQTLLEVCREDIPVYVGESRLLEGLTGYQMTRGVLAVFRRPTMPTMEQVCGNARRIAVLEEITDSTNVGAIFRSAAALGMDAVLLSPGCCDPLCRRSVRVSMGTVFQVPWARISGGRPEEGMMALRQLGFKTAALALNSQSVRVDDASLMAEKRLALLLGTEGTGLKQETVQASDYTVMIPMAHGVDSLNVAAAAAVAFWQLRCE